MENEASGLGASPLPLRAWRTVGAQRATSECVKGEAAKTCPQGPRWEATLGSEPAAPGSWNQSATISLLLGVTLREQVHSWLAPWLWAPGGPPRSWNNDPFLFPSPVTLRPPLPQRATGPDSLHWGHSVNRHQVAGDTTQGYRHRALAP